MLAEHNVDTSLRARVEFLEEENRQLREMIGLDDDMGFILTARETFGATAAQARLLQVLITGKVVRTAALMAACSPDGYLATDNNLKVQLSRLRAKLAPHGIQIINNWSVGYSIAAEHRSKVLEIMAAAVSDDGAEIAAQ